MNRTRIKSELAALIRKSKSARTAPGAYAFLPEIIESLIVMEKSLDADADRRSRIAGALGRLITEDLAFSESDLGQALLALGDEFASG